MRPCVPFFACCSSPALGRGCKPALSKPSAFLLTPAFFASCSASDSASLLLPQRTTVPCAMGLRIGSAITRVCPCGGDRTKRHNRLRAVLAARTSAAALSPEVEKPGLLPARPHDHGCCEAGGSAAIQGRRPADVWVPLWGLHGPAAFNLAVTSGLRSGAVAASASGGSHACVAYEAKKRAHQDTAHQCSEQGLQFVPLVAEACGGGWGPTAISTRRSLGALLSARTGESKGIVTDQLLQAFSVTLQRENARAVLRRVPQSDSVRAASGASLPP